ncbi:MAG: peptidylprolyl isomerase [Ilumatobacteraceae bacterium]|nr:peptidylprolyl isomerase [Ilumatobacteraceae bacterium]
MRRHPVTRAAGLALVSVTLVAACGASDDPAPVAEPAAEVDGTDDDEISGTDDGTDDGDGADDGASTTTVDTELPGGKPEVQIPDELPTELVVTDLIEGTGPEAEAGDTVVVNYVGVRSEDGFEFDNSYDRGQPFPVQLGAGSVIQGWDLGLVGARVGTRRQLDIPAELAYGDADRGDIRPGDALTFVIDVLAIEKPPVITAPPKADEAACAIDESAPQVQQFDEMQPFCIDVGAVYTAEIVTNFGPITIELLPEQAPQTVNNFVMLARNRYFDGTECHRAIPGFVVQCGDPTATGTGGPGYRFPDELPVAGEYRIGSLAMANSGPDTNGSQFFIITGDDGASLPPLYSLFGQVTEGLDSTVADLDAVANPANNGVPPLETIIIESVTITES